MNQEQTGMDILDLGNPLRSEPPQPKKVDTPALQEQQEFGISDLATAFNIFNRVSNELDKSYHGLETRVSELNSELAKTREERSHEVNEKAHQIDRLEALLSVLPSGVVVMDKNSIVTEVNPKAVDLLGEPLMGLSWSGIVSRIAVPEVRTGFELKLRDGRILSLMSRELGNTSERVILITEVTAIHENQERVNRDKRLAALGEMAASLAHQIRTPLSSAMLYMSQLSLSRLPQEARSSMAGKLQERLAHMSNLIDSMLSFVRGAKPNTQVVSLNNLIEKTEGIVKLPASRAGACVNFSDPDSSLMIHGDTDALAGAIANLVMNGIEMNPNNPWVSIAVDAISPTQVEIRVSDNGPGIANQHMEKIFDPFFTTRVQGTGLGLAVVAMTVAAHEGEIRADNRDSGGAEFIIRLPLLSTASEIGFGAGSSPELSRPELNKEVA